MPRVWIPSLLLELTQGQEAVTVPGETLRQVIAHLEERFPGIEERLCDPDGQLRRNLAVVVDGVVSQQRMRHKLTEDSQVHFIPAISGGSWYVFHPSGKMNTEGEKYDRNQKSENRRDRRGEHGQQPCVRFRQVGKH